MLDKTYRTLEFDKVRELIAEHAATEEAKREILSMEVFTEMRPLTERLDEISEALSLMKVKGRLPIGGYVPATELIIHAHKGGSLREGALLRVSRNIRYAVQVKEYIEKKTNVTLSCPLMEEYAFETGDFTSLGREIDRAIISEDEVSDAASPELARIRRQIKQTNTSIKEKLRSSVKGASEKYMQEGFITMRGGRYVVPVKSEYRSSVEGIVHDTSQSGNTYFIEPQAVVNLNNDLKQLEIKEQREIDRILAELSSRVEANATGLKHNEEILVKLDGIFARASYAYDSEHTRPVITEDGVIDLRKARHPLLERKKAVPSDIGLGESYTQIVITGPNTGGKTVTLKCLGLCCLMAQAGLFIPANEGSSVTMLRDIFADIGDEQSIAQSLSTFSSHMVNISEILSLVGEGCLVLLDELGAGTDPSEGAALAKAILRRIKDSGALCVATTHYNEIKQYALTESGAVNASVEFDTVNLRPTYRLSIGLPGRSNAFEISRRLGISEDIIREAAEDMTVSDVRFEDMISSLQKKLAETQKVNEEAKRLRDEAQRSADTLRNELERYQKSRDEQYARAVTEAKKILNDAREETRRILSEAQKLSNGNADFTRMRGEITDSLKKESERLSALMPENALSRDVPGSGKQEKLAKNDEVHIPSLNADGTILEIDGDMALVQVGMIKTRLALSKLTPVKAAKQKSFSYTGMKAQSVSPKLDIRGITASEVALEVEKYLDDCALAGLKSVTIVHGKGNGILRKAVAEVLDHNPSVESYRIGGLNEGSTGATVVTLK